MYIICSVISRFFVIFLYSRRIVHPKWTTFCLFNLVVGSVTGPGFFLTCRMSPLYIRRIYSVVWRSRPILERPVVCKIQSCKLTPSFYVCSEGGVEILDRGRGEGWGGGGGVGGEEGKEISAKYKGYSVATRRGPWNKILWYCDVPHRLSSRVQLSSKTRSPHCLEVNRNWWWSVAWSHRTMNGLLS